MTRLARALVAMAVAALPQQERRRYAEELDADMLSQPRWGRLWYAVSIVLAMPRMRWELLRRLAGQPVPACFVAIHRDRTLHPNPEAGWIVSRECMRCHRVHDPRQYGRRGRVNDLRAWYSAHSGS